MRDLPENIDSKYRFITIAAKRCEMLQKGAKPKIDEDRYAKFSKIAMEEVLDGLIDFEIIAKDKESAEPEEPEELEEEEPQGFL